MLKNIKGQQTVSAVDVLEPQLYKKDKAKMPSGGHYTGRLLWLCGASC